MGSMGNTLFSHDVPNLGGNALALWPEIAFPASCPKFFCPLPPRLLNRFHIEAFFGPAVQLHNLRIRARGLLIRYPAHLLKARLVE